MRVRVRAGRKHNNMKGLLVRNTHLNSHIWPRFSIDYTKCGYSHHFKGNRHTHSNNLAKTSADDLQ